MAQLKVYGIKNCNTMKKAFAWLEDHGVDYSFEDYKKNGADEALLKKAMKKHGWEAVINRKGTSWRKLPESQRAAMDEEAALAAALDNPSLIKRPMLVRGQMIVFGFDAAEYTNLL